MTTPSVMLYRMKKILAELSNKRGRGTELVSLYIPAKKPLHEVTSALREEYGTASNIKSDTTRVHVQDALVKTMQRLKLYDRTTENGLVIFCGALPTDGPGSEVVSLYEVVPHKPIQNYLYRCDDHFHLEPLREMLKEEALIGVLAIDATEAGLGIVLGDSWEVLEVVTSGVSGKHRAGGQSARRFERLREMKLIDYFNRVASHATGAFLEERQIKGLIVSGPAYTKNDFLKEGYLDYRLRNNVLAVIDTTYAGREGIRETLEKADKVLEDVRLMEEMKLVQRFLKEVNAPDGNAIYGIHEILEPLKKASVDTILVSEDVPLVHLKAVCKKCGDEREGVVTKANLISERQALTAEPCRACRSAEIEVAEKDIIEYLDEVSSDFGTRVEVISSKTEEGSMLKSFGGIAAFLRYR